MFDAAGIACLLLAVITGVAGLVLVGMFIKNRHPVAPIFAVLFFFLAAVCLLVTFVIRPANHREHLQAVADMDRQHIRYSHLSITDGGTIAPIAGKCFLPSMKMGKVDGVWTPEIQVSTLHGRRYEPFPANTIKRIGQLPPCNQ